MNMLDMTHDLFICRGSVFCGVVIREAGPSGVVSGFDGRKPSVLDREAGGSIKLSD